MEFITPPEKIDALKTSIKVFAKRPFATPKDASRITGRLISLLPAFDKITRLFTRHLYQFIDDHYLLYDQKSLNAEVKGELKIWLKNLDAKNGHNIKHNPTITKIIYSDASDSGYGGYILQQLGLVVAQDSFLQSERL